MRETWFLFWHFWKADVRAQHSIAGLVLFAIATVYAAYQVVQGFKASASLRHSARGSFLTGWDFFGIEDWAKVCETRLVC